MGVALTSPRPAHGALNWDTALEADLAAIATAFNTTTSIASTDLNALTQSGWYSGATLGNSPDGTTGTFLVLSMYRSTTSASQTAVKLADGTIWSRTLGGSGSWGTWTRTATTAQLPQDTGWTLSPLTIATGWTTLVDPNSVAAGGTGLAGGVRNNGGLLEYRFRVTRTGATMTADASGNIADTPVATINPTTWPQYMPTAPLYGHFYNVGVRAGTARLDLAGSIQITDLYPSSPVSTNDVLQISLFGLAG